MCLELLGWDLGPLWDFYFLKFMLSREVEAESPRSLEAENMCRISTEKQYYCFLVSGKI